METEKHRIWAIALVVAIIVVCLTSVWLNSHPYVMRFEMDNNTLAAIKSINWSNVTRT